LVLLLPNEDMQVFFLSEGRGGARTILNHPEKDEGKREKERGGMNYKSLS
jgi:hypothetical protein